MFVANTTSEILNLFLAIDAQETFERKITILENWATRLPHVKAMRFFWFKDPQAPLCREDEEFSPFSPVMINKDVPVPPIVETYPDYWESCLYYPLPAKGGKSPGFLLFKTPNPFALLTDQSTELGLIASKLGDALELNERTLSTSKISDHHLYDPEYRYIMETLNLPLYLAHLSGEFVFANTPFLQQFGFQSLQELNAYRHQLFCTSERAMETKELVEQGSVNGYQISVNLPSGQTMTVRDYATLRNAHILGIIFDVSDYVNLNSEMKAALEIQELLNDKIMSSALILQKTQTTSIRALARLAEYRDQETGHHLKRICRYTEVLVKEVLRTQPFAFQITEQYVHDMVLSSMLHDVGKVAVPDHILRKKNNLSAEEWEVMKKHTLWGWQILSQADKELGEQSFLTLASQIAISHHERWDGTGYPQGLKGDKIPLSARIESIADVYDALTSVRPYKKAWSHEEALDEIQSQNGLQFDPTMVEVFMRVADQFNAIKSQYSGETSQ
jgi:response regulator RpfG family c-di-GMP phosphodiesterase